jgi:hypothetical protein
MSASQQKSWLTTLGRFTPWWSHCNSCCGMRCNNTIDHKTTLQELTLLVYDRNKQTTRIWGPEITLELNHIRCCCRAAAELLNYWLWYGCVMSHESFMSHHEAKSRTFETGGGFGWNCHAITKHLICSMEHRVSAWENLSPKSGIMLCCLIELLLLAYRQYYNIANYEAKQYQ